MFFPWPTINDRTLSGERRERNLRDLESRMNAFLIEKSAQACPQIIDRVRRSRADVRKENRLRRAVMPDARDVGAQQQGQ